MEGEWCGEASLWTAWSHQGALHAITVAEVIAIDSSSFAKITRAHKHVYHCAAKYAALFVQQLNEESDQGRVSDVACSDAEEWEELANAAFNVRRDWKRSFTSEPADASNNEPRRDEVTGLKADVPGMVMQWQSAQDPIVNE